MTRQDEFIGQVESYLDEYEASTPLPEDVRDAIRAQLPAIQQRPAWWPGWRLPEMNSMAKLALSAAAIVVVALLGFNFLVPGGNVGAPAAPTPKPTPSADGEPLAREWIDALNRGDADTLLRLTAERVETDGVTVSGEDKVAEVLETWCPMTVDSVERVGDSYLMTATFADNADSTCTAGAPGTTGTFVLEVRDGKVTRTP